MIDLQGFLYDKSGTLPRREVRGQERLDLLTDFWPPEIETTDVQKPNDSRFVDQESVWDNIEIEQAAKRVGAIHRRPK